jgi:YHS domain-containing protein
MHTTAFFVTWWFLCAKIIMKQFSSKERKQQARYMHDISSLSITFFSRIILTAVISLLAIGMLQAQKFHGKYFNNVDANNVILDGYDAVAFFTENKPVKGSADYQYKYEDAVYYFASKENRDLFASNPEKYKPQFGGWCGYAVSLGKIAPIDVNTFSIVNGRLVVQHNQRAVNGWNKDVQGNLGLADKYWPEVAKHGGQQITTDAEKNFLNNTDADGVTLQGYDAVAYFTENKAVKGNPSFTARYDGATYWFASQQNADMFKNQPAKYAPQYGSFCGYAMSLNKLRPIDPTLFQIVDGRLILQHTAEAFRLFNKDVAGNTAKADGYWPGQVKKHAGRKVKFDKAAKPAPETK